MGLFDWLSGLLGGRESDADAVGRGSVNPDESGGEASVNRDATRQSHGSHWDTVVAPPDRETTIEAAVMETVESGEPVETGTDEVAVVGYRDRPDPVGATVVALDGQVATGYPVAEGVVHEIEVTSLTGWETDIEAWVDGTLDDAAVTFFSTDHFEHRSDPPGGTATVSLAVLLYSLSEADADETVVTDDGEELSLAGMAGFFPYGEGAPDDYAVRTTVSAVERWSWRDAEGYRLRAPLFRTESGEAVDVAMYVADHNLADGYEPAVDDDVEGLGWLQGTFE